MEDRVIYTVTTGRHKYLRMPVRIVFSKIRGDTFLRVAGKPYNSDWRDVWMEFHPENFSELPIELKAKLSMMRLKGELK